MKNLSFNFYREQMSKLANWATKLETNDKLIIPSVASLSFKLPAGELHRHLTRVGLSQRQFRILFTQRSVKQWTHLHNLRLVKFRDTLCFSPRAGPRRTSATCEPDGRWNAFDKWKRIALFGTGNITRFCQSVRSLSVRPACDILFISMYKAVPGTMRKHKVYMRYKFQIASELAWQRSNLLEAIFSLFTKFVHVQGNLYQ